MNMMTTDRHLLFPFVLLCGFTFGPVTSSFQVTASISDTAVESLTSWNTEADSHILTPSILTESVAAPSVSGSPHTQLSPSSLPTPESSADFTSVLRTTNIGSSIPFVTSSVNNWTDSPIQSPIKPTNVVLTDFTVGASMNSSTGDSSSINNTATASHSSDVSISSYLIESTFADTWTTSEHLQPTPTAGISEMVSSSAISDTFVISIEPSRPDITNTWTVTPTETLSAEGTIALLSSMLQDSSEYLEEPTDSFVFPSLAYYSSDVTSESMVSSSEVSSFDPIVTESYESMWSIEPSVVPSSEFSASSFKTEVLPSVLISYQTSLFSQSELLEPSTLLISPSMTLEGSQEFTSVVVEPSLITIPDTGPAFTSGDITEPTMSPTTDTMSSSILFSVTTPTTDIPSTSTPSTEVTPRYVTSDTTSSISTTDSTATSVPHITDQPTMASTTARPQEPYTVQIKLVLSGNCTVLNNMKERDNLIEFKANLIDSLSVKLSILSNNIYISSTECGSIVVVVHIVDVTDDMNMKDSLDAMIEEGELFMAANNTYSFSLISSEILSDDGGPTKKPVSPPKHQPLTNVQIIVIIVCSIVGGMLLMYAFGFCIYACYQKRRTKSFDLGETPACSLDMEDFTLTKLQRPATTYSENGMVMQNGHSNKMSRKNGHYQSIDGEMQCLEPEDIHLADTLPRVTSTSNMDKSTEHPAEPMSHQSSTGFENPSFSGDDMMDARHEICINSGAGHENPCYETDSVPTTSTGEGATAF